jgi:hypothetical protein
VDARKQNEETQKQQNNPSKSQEILVFCARSRSTKAQFTKKENRQNTIYQQQKKKHHNEQQAKSTQTNLSRFT